MFVLILTHCVCHFDADICYCLTSHVFVLILELHMVFVIILPFDVCHDLTLYACGCFKERKAEEAKAAAEQREKDRFLGLSDREKVMEYFELTAFISW